VQGRLKYCNGDYRVYTVQKKGQCLIQTPTWIPVYRNINLAYLKTSQRVYAYYKLVTGTRL